MARFKASLSAQRQHLIREMQRINFGHFEYLVILRGEPLFDPPPRAQVEIKFGAENGPRPECAADDFELKQQVVELFAYFDSQQDGVIDLLEIKHGLPFRMFVKGASV